MLSSQVVNTYEKFLREIKSATVANTQTNKQKTGQICCCYGESVSDLDRSNRLPHPFEPKPTPGQGSNSLQLCEGPER